MNLYKSGIKVHMAQGSLFLRLLFVLLLVLPAGKAFSQQPRIVKKITQRDISDSTRQLFYAQADSMEKFKRGIYPVESDSSRFYSMPCNSLLTYRPSVNDPNVCLIKPSFGKTGGMGCGYFETGEPNKITVQQQGKQFPQKNIYDFNDSTAWISSANYKQDKINLHFGKYFSTLTSIIFYGGNQSNYKNWKKYARPKTIAVYINNKFWSNLQFDDCTCVHRFDFKPIAYKGRSMLLSFVIKDVYKGEDSRVAISEINFDGYYH